MFNRRIKPNFLTTLRNFIWPKIGLKRALNYWVHRISRLPDSTYAISAGIAFGASISFTPFVGLHFILAGLLDWIFRANIIASACLLYTSPSPRDGLLSRMPSSA